MPSVEEYNLRVIKCKMHNMLRNPKMNHKIVRRMKVLKGICNYNLVQGGFRNGTDHHTLGGEVKNFNWEGSGRGPFCRF